MPAAGTTASALDAHRHGLVLDHERCAAEEAARLHAKKKSTCRAAARLAGAQATILDGD